MFRGIEHPQRIERHVVHGVRRLQAPAKLVLQAFQQKIGRAQRVELMAQSHIAVVKPHHTVTGVNQGVHQRQRPGRQLHAQAHDEQHRRPWTALPVSTVAVDLNFQRDSICS